MSNTANEMKTLATEKELQNGGTCEQPAIKRNWIQKVGDWWQRQTTPGKVVTGLGAAGLATGGFFLVKALLNNNSEDDEEEDDDIYADDDDEDND